MRLHNPAYGEEQQETPQEDEDMDLSVIPEHLVEPPAWISPLLVQSIHRVAVAKHIRVVFVPSVSHLRAWLAVFPPADSKTVQPPPAAAMAAFSRKTDIAPLLLLYGFLDLHRDTSEWSAQGLSNTAATLIEAARLAALRPVIVEQRIDWSEQLRDSESLLSEEIPLLSGAERRAAAREGGSGWIGRTVSVRRVLGRWFRFQEDVWDELREDKPDDAQSTADPAM